jgi:hypothetical protein
MGSLIDVGAPLAMNGRTDVPSATSAPQGPPSPPPPPLAGLRGEFLDFLDTKAWPAWRETGYVQYDRILHFVKEATTVTSGMVIRPEEQRRKFVDILDAQLERVNTFVAQQQEVYCERWKNLDVPRSEVGTDEARATLSVLKSHLNRKCSAAPGQCQALNRLRAEDGNRFAELTVLFEELQSLQALVRLNHQAFEVGMRTFELETGLDVKPIFGRTLAKAPFFHSPGISQILEELRCVSKDLILRLDTDTSPGTSDLREEFKCGVCLDVLQNPVVLSCSHRFCWHCAASSCVTSTACDDWACPICRKTQPVSADVFTVNKQLQSFINEHVLSPPDSPSLMGVPALPALPAESGWSDFNFSDIVARREDAQRGLSTASAQVEDPFEHLPVMDVTDIPQSVASAPSPKQQAVKRALQSSAAAAAAVSAQSPRSGATFVGQWISMDDTVAFGLTPPPLDLAATTAKAAEIKVKAVAVSQPPAPPRHSTPPTKQRAAINEAAKPQATGTGTSQTEQPKRKRGRPPATGNMTEDERRELRLKKNRLAAQKSYRKRMANNAKFEKTHNDIVHSHNALKDELAAALETIRRYEDFVQLKGLREAAVAEAGLQPVPDSLALAAARQLGPVLPVYKQESGAKAVAPAKRGPVVPASQVKQEGVNVF